MRLLVSVASATEASAALDGGADVIDAKDPLAGALGAVSVGVLREIRAAIEGRRPLTAALGDAADEAAIARDARMFAEAGVGLVKIGFAGITDAARVSALIASAVHGVGDARNGAGGVVAVAYADAERASSLAPVALLQVAARAGAQGVLLDTADKSGPGLRHLVTPTVLGGWVTEAHKAGLIVALAGKLTEEDLAIICDAGADIAGVRGAACEGGREGRVSADKVRRLRARCAPGGDSSHRMKPLLSLCNLNSEG